MSNRVSIEREVAWGESREGAVAKRWLDLSETGKKAVRVIKSSDYDDFDFYVFGKNGYPLAWLETKVRTIDFGVYGDAMFPRRKHDYAVAMMLSHKIPVLAVTEYACGTLAEICLWDVPAEFKSVTRRDRGGKPVPHCFYKKYQMKILSSG